jgi:hypothetical protein
MTCHVDSATWSLSCWIIKSNFFKGKNNKNLKGFKSSYKGSDKWSSISKKLTNHYWAVMATNNVHRELQKLQKFWPVIIDGYRLSIMHKIVDHALLTVTDRQECYWRSQTIKNGIDGLGPPRITANIVIFVGSRLSIVLPLFMPLSNSPSFSSLSLSL